MTQGAVTTPLPTLYVLIGVYDYQWPRIVMCIPADRDIVHQIETRSGAYRIVHSGTSST